MKNSRYERTTRSGVPSSPSRLGSSPAQRISVRIASMACSRVGRCTAAGGSGRRSDKAAECDTRGGQNSFSWDAAHVDREIGKLPGRRTKKSKQLVIDIDQNGK